MISEELKKYIDDARRQGMNDKQIKQNLTASGWSEFDVNQALNPQSVPPPPPLPSSSPPPPFSPTRTAATQSNSAIMGVLAYLGILIVIPFIMAKDDSFVKFHIKQGLTLIVFWFGIWIISFALGIFLAVVRFPLFGLISIFFPLLWLLSAILAIVGIINAATGKMKELPVIGGWGNKFNF